MTVGQVKDYMAANNVDYATAYGRLAQMETPAYGASGTGVVNASGQVVEQPKTDTSTNEVLTPTVLSNNSVVLKDQNGVVKKLLTGEDAAAYTQANNLKTNVTDAELDSILNNYPTLSIDQKSLLKAFANSYSGGITDYTEIINTFNKLATESLDPYFANLASQAKLDVAKSKSYLDATRAIELETERANADQAIENAKKTLEAYGMTFSGEALKTLGSASAEANPTGLEGLVQKSNRLTSTSSQARYDENVRQLARNYESSYGTEAASELFGTSPLAGGVTKEYSTQGQSQESTKSSVLNRLLNQYQGKQSLLTNQ